jgi:hypothetical protein
MSFSYLRDQVKKYRKEYSLNEGKAFGLWYAVDSLELEEDEAYEAVSFDGGNDKDIDLFYIDQESERVLIAQLKFNAKGQYKGRKNELLGLIHTTDWLKDSESLERDGRHDLAAAAKDYVDGIGRGFSVEYIYTEDSAVDTRAEVFLGRLFNLQRGAHVHFDI